MGIHDHEKYVKHYTVDVHVYVYVDLIEPKTTNKIDENQEILTGSMPRHNQMAY